MVADRLSIQNPPPASMERCLEIYFQRLARRSLRIGQAIEVILYRKGRHAHLIAYSAGPANEGGPAANSGGQGGQADAAKNAIGRMRFDAELNIGESDAQFLLALIDSSQREADRRPGMVRVGRIVRNKNKRHKRGE